MRTKHSVGPIAISEAASSCVSIGSVILMAHHDRQMEPLRNFLAERCFYPLMKRRPKDLSDEEAREQAHKHASAFLKGAIMIGTGFASHIPLQLALEKHCDATSFKRVVFGKTIGVSVALGGLGLLRSVAPEILPKAQAASAHVLRRFFPGKSHQTLEEVCALLFLDIPSSLIAGLVNYYATSQRGKS